MEYVIGWFPKLDIFLLDFIHLRGIGIFRSQLAELIILIISIFQITYFSFISSGKSEFVEILAGKLTELPSDRNISQLFLKNFMKIFEYFLSRSNINGNNYFSCCKRTNLVWWLQQTRKILAHFCVWKIEVFRSRCS